MKKLYGFTIKSFVGPFLITFVISIFLLVMQFFWKYIDDLMGKGLDILVVLELLFYVSASIVPLALPLAVLISSIMTLGNLAENNELTAMKSSGLSLYKIMKPLAFVMVFLCIGTFYFSNYALPVANLKWRWIIYDVQQQKPAFSLDENRFYYDIENYGIRVAKIDKEKSILKDVTIYDHSNPMLFKIIKAKSGQMRNSSNGRFLFLELQNGWLYENLSGTNNKKPQNLPFQKSQFDKFIIKFDLSDFSMERSNEELFKNNVEMLNVFQLNEAIDSVKEVNNEVRTKFSNNIKNQHGLFLSEVYVHGEFPSQKEKDSKRNNFLPIRNMKEKEDVVEEIAHDSLNISIEKKDSIHFNFSSISDKDLAQAVQTSIIKIRSRKEEVDQYTQILETRKGQFNKYNMEWHRKFTLSVSIFILFFIGAPLGAIIRKGGLGMPMVVAVLLFLFYYVLMIVGEKMVKSDVLTPAVGMWLPSFILGPIAIFISYKASKESQLFSKEKFLKLFMVFKRKKS